MLRYLASVVFRPIPLVFSYLGIGVFTLAWSQPSAGINLPRPAQGSAAIAALGSRLDGVASAYGVGGQQLTTMFQTQPSLGVDKNGALVFACNGLVATGPANSMTATTSTAQLAFGGAVDAFELHSFPGAAKVIYLDFTGHSTSGTSWNSGYTNNTTIVSQPFDLDGDSSSFSPTERAVIQGIWKRVAEDYAPFAIDVTTQDPGVDALRRSPSPDQNYGVRIVISPTNWYDLNAGGTAYIGSFNWNTDTPCFVFTQQLGSDEKNIAEAAAHEAGHTLGLYHDGIGGTAPSEYYFGHGDWAPIMGVGYYKPIVQFSKGEYATATNTQDDFAVIATFAPLAGDDHGNTTATATLVAGPVVATGGTIETQGDVDLFRFTLVPGNLALAVQGPSPNPNLNLQAELLNGSGQVILTSNPTTMDAPVVTTVTTVGTYYLRISGVGSGNVNTGYSTYGSVGNYVITGTIPTGSTNQAPIAVATASVTSGPAPLAVNFTGSASTDADGSVVSHAWTFGDGGSSNVANPAHVYSVAGNYTATLTVTDNLGLTGSATVSIAALSVPPTITVPANMVVEATGPGGAVVAYTTSAVSATGGSLATVNVPVSGTTFPLGMSTVTASATDAVGNTASKSFTVTVVDTTAPVITVPANLTVPATSGAGAVVTFATSATDSVSGARTTTNSPASGSTFAVGTTTVTTSANDAVGNNATRTFTVTVTALAAPAAPSGVAAAAGDGRVDLTWNAVSGATGYRVKRSMTSGGPYTTVASDVAGVSYADTGLSNGTTYYYVVTASNANGESVNSTQVSAAPAAPNTALVAFVTNTAPGTLRSDYTGWVGMRIEVGANALTVSELGRLVAPGNSNAHTVKLVRASDGIDVPGGAVSVATSGATPGTFRFGSLASAVTLAAGGVYYVMSEEFTGSDSWYDLNTSISTSDVATSTGAVWGSGPGAWTAMAVANRSYVPVNFKYATGASSLVTGFSPGTLRNDFSGWVGMRVDVGSSPLTVSELGRMVAPGNSGAHTIKLVKASDGSDVLGGTVTISTSAAPVGTFRYGALGAPLTLTANTSYYVLSQELAGGDSWYDLNTSISTTGAAAATGAVWGFGPGLWNPIAFANRSYVPVTFKYALGAASPALPTIVVPSNLVAEATGPAGAAVGFTTSAQSSTGTVLATVNVPSSGSTFPLGTTTVTTSATDSVGNSATRTFTVTVFDTTAPTITVPANLTVEATSGAGAAVSFVTSAFDGVSGARVTTNSPSSGTLFPIGTNTVTATASDAAGNSASRTFTINVTAMPVLSSPSGVAATAGDRRVDLSWAPVATANGYRVKRATASNGPFNTIANSLQTTSYADTNLSNGTTYYYVVTATGAVAESADSSIVSATPAGAAVALNALVTNVVPGTVRSDFTGWVGMRIDVGTSSLTISELGRMAAPGNSGTHTLKLVSAADGNDVPNGAVNVSLSGASPGAFAYAALNSPVTLPAGTSYFLLSEETSGGDTWYDMNTAVTTANVAAASGAVWGFGPGAWNPIPVANRSYVPVNFKYSVSTSEYVTTVQPGSARNNYSGWVGMQFTVGSTPISVASVGRMMASGNVEAHTVKIVRASDGQDVAGGGALVSMSGGVAGQFRYGTLPNPVILTPGTTYWIVSQESAGGDSWYDLDTVVTTRSEAASTGVVWGAGPGEWTAYPYANRSYVPLSFTFTSAAN